MTNSTHLRIAAAGLVIGPVLFTTADLFRRMVEPVSAFSDKQLADAVGQRPGLWAAAGLLSVLASVFFLPGVAALFLTARGRGARVTATGAAMVGIGLLASVGHAVGYFGPFSTYAEAHASAATITSLESVGSGPMVVLCIVLFMIGMMLGSIVLLAGLRRARRVPVWSVVAVVVFVACGSTGGVVPGVLGILAALAAFVPAARSLNAGSSDLRHDGAQQLAHA